MLPKAVFERLQPLIKLFVDACTSTGRDVNLENVLQNLAYTINRNKVLMSKISHKCLNTLSILNWSSNALWKVRSSRNSAAWAPFFFNAMFCDLDLGLRNVEYLPFFCTLSGNILKMTPTPMAECRCMYDDEIRLFSLQEPFSDMAHLSSRLLV